MTIIAHHDESDALTVAELRDAQRTNPGRIWHPHRHIMLGRDTCNGSCETRNGCDCAPMPAEACTEVGHRDAFESMLRYRRTKNTAALAMALAVAAFVVQPVWPAVA